MRDILKIASPCAVFGPEVITRPHWRSSHAGRASTARLSACVTDLALGSHAVGAIDPNIFGNDAFGRLLKAQVFLELW